jgi:hypothetical protein
LNKKVMGWATKKYNATIESSCIIVVLPNNNGYHTRTLTTHAHAPPPPNSPIMSAPGFFQRNAAFGIKGQLSAPKVLSALGHAVLIPAVMYWWAYKGGAESAMTYFNLTFAPLSPARKEGPLLRARHAVLRTLDDGRAAWGRRHRWMTGSMLRVIVAG